MAIRIDLPSHADEQAGLDAYNRFVADLWGGRQGEIAERAAEAVREIEREESDIRDLELLTLDLRQPPALHLTRVGELTPPKQRWALALPGTGSWRLRLRGRFKVPLLGFKRVTVDVVGLAVEVELSLRRESAISGHLLDESRTRFKVERVDVDSSNVVLHVIAELVEGALRRLLKRKGKEALDDMLPRAAKARAIAALDLASEAPPVHTGAVPEAELEAAAIGFSRRIQQFHLPFNTILTSRLAAADPAAPAVAFAHFQDSAIWTGHYLAGELFRFRVTGEQAALDNLERALFGLEELVALTVDDGLLSRVAVPFTSPHMESLRLDIVERHQEERLFESRTPAGEPVLAVGHITRDQVAGAILGCGLAALQLPDGGAAGVLKARARTVALAMVDYLIRRRFCPGEARTDTAQPDRTSVFYLTNPGQVLAILSLADRLDRPRFGVFWDDYEPAAEVCWLFTWLQTLDPDSSYYKFNLEHSLGLLLLLGAEPAEAARLGRFLLAQRQALARHDNAWFNLVELAAFGDDPDLLTRPRSTIEGEVRRQLIDFLRRPALFERVELADDPAIDKVDYTPLSGASRRIARQPVPVAERPSTDFLWQRSPFSLRSVLTIEEGVFLQPPGIDYLLPYWLARFLGVLEGP